MSKSHLRNVSPPVVCLGIKNQSVKNFRGFYLRRTSHVLQRGGLKPSKAPSTNSTCGAAAYCIVALDGVHVDNSRQ